MCGVMVCVRVKSEACVEWKGVMVCVRVKE